MKKEIAWLLSEKYHNKPNQKFKDDMLRLEKGEPLDYVIGFTEFLGCRIDLSKKPLIPRPETEYWVQKAIEEMSRDFKSFAKHGTKILDMFTGSGCIGIAILKYVGNSQVTFVEKDKNLLKQIEINCKINNIGKKRYNIIQSDIFSNVKGAFDYILANPPYIPIARKNKIQKSVLHYESPVALFGGEDGLLYIRKFLTDAKNFLNPNGKIYMEFDSIQKKDIERLLKKLHYQDFEFFKDQYGKWRWVVIILNN